MRSIFLGTIIIVLGFIGIGFYNEMMKKSPVYTVDNDENFLPKKVKRRGPASEEKATKTANVRPRELSVTSSLSNDGNFRQNVDLPPHEEPRDEKNPAPTLRSGYQSIYDSSPSNRVSSSGVNSGKSNNSSGSAKSSFGSSSHKTSGIVAFNNVGNSPTTTSSGNSSTNSSSSGGNSSGSTTEDTLSCSSSLGGGTFGNPIQVSLTCTSSANIKYCIQDGSCCDPEISGITYSGPIVIGAENGNFCLSFYGESSLLKLSNVVQQSYTINNTYPDIQVTFPKILFQTTQLAGLHYLRSNDFSKSNFWIGEINLKTHDPGPSGLNMDCQDIVENYVTLPIPTPTQIFSLMDMAPITLGSQLNVPLQLSGLSYGDNFLTSYVLNDNYAAPLYSCSTNKVTVKDFEFFAPEASHGETGTNQVRVFSGGFVAYSFFEPEATVYRGPAGQASEEDNGQELRLGSFGVFY